MLEPYKGRVYDPCCGSGGMFVQSEKFVVEHVGRVGDIRVYGLEMNNTTWRLAKMNMAVRGIDADIKWNNEGSFHKDELAEPGGGACLASQAITQPREELTQSYTAHLPTSYMSPERTSCG